jgi:hypothetical protein
MSNTFFAGQTDYIEKLNLLALYSDVSQVPINTTNALLGWSYAQAFAVATATRNSNESVTTANIVWPDGATGVFTSTVLSTLFPGAIDAWNATHILAGVTKTVTQPTVTRNAAGAVIAQPSITVV